MFNTAQRPALGQSAELGALYDARTDTFILPSLLTSSAPASSVSVTDNHTSEVKISTSDTYSEKLSKMNMNAELSASFLSGMVTVGGSGRFLTDTLESNRILQASLHYSITTVDEKLNFMNSELKQCLDMNALQSGAATHVVAGIGWGAQSVVTAKHRMSNSEKRTEVEGQFHAEFTKFQSIVEVDGTEELSVENQEHGKGMSVEVTVYGDVLADDELLPTDFQSACKFIKNVPHYIAAANGGKGKPLIYTLLPLGMLAYLMQVEVTAGITITQLSVDCLERFVHFFDDLRDAQKKLNDYYSDVNNHRFCVPANHRQVVRQHVNKSKVFEADVKSKYARLLEDVRSGKADAGQLWSLLKDSTEGNQSPESMIQVTNVYREKMELADHLIAKGAKYIGYGKSLDIELISNSYDDAYVLYFNENSRRDRSSWEGNQQLIIEFFNDTQRPKQVILLDCDASNISIEKSHIKRYRNGRVIVDDVLEQRLLMGDKCFARYDEVFLDTSGVERPLQRSFVKLPCPGSYCVSNAKPYDWICFKCNASIEYGLTDHYIYCDCGRTHYTRYDFKCKEARHGSAFAKFNEMRLLQLLNALEPFPELNILILGETGVGKSTFINAFINYLTFETLDDAIREDKLVWSIPCSFSTQYVDKDDPDGNFVQKDIKIGNSENEADGSAGHSATQKTSIYPVPVGDTIVRLIDTPGIGDTRGTDKDRENMADILSTLRYFPKLHGILILLKPNNSRLTLMFRFCIKELLTHLHRDAARNMVFGFTNTRTSDYKPGDTFKPLQALLGEHKDVGIPLSKYTVYCFDSESFRFLAAQKSGVDMENIDDYRRSWERSGKEAQRLLDHFRGLQPHLVKSTLSLNRTRELIAQLTKPMADITQTIETTIRVNEDNVQELMQKRVRGDELRARLKIKKVVLKLRDLEKPRTVCSDRSCIEFRDNGNGKTETIYKSMCHKECYLSGITTKVVGPPELAGCAAFNGQENCAKCGHHWMQHLHVKYELHEETIDVKDSAIENQLQKNATDIILKQTAIEGIRKMIRESEAEHKQIQDAAVKFGLFLKRNSITPYNDAMLELLDHQIREESDKVAWKETNGAQLGNGPVDRKKLNDLIRRRKEYAQRITAILKSMASGDTTEVLDEDGVDQLVQSLYNLKHWGKNLKDIKSGAESADMAAYRERPYCIPRNKKSKRSKENNAFTQASQGSVEPPYPAESGQWTNYNQLPQQVAKEDKSWGKWVLKRGSGIVTRVTGLFASPSRDGLDDSD